jgi:hypothetical protein
MLRRAPGSNNKIDVRESHIFAIGAVSGGSGYAL